MLTYIRNFCGQTHVSGIFSDEIIHLLCPGYFGSWNDFIKHKDLYDGFKIFSPNCTLNRVTYRKRKHIPCLNQNLPFKWQAASIDLSLNSNNFDNAGLKHMKYLNWLYHVYSFAHAWQKKECVRTYVYHENPNYIYIMKLRSISPSNDIVVPTNLLQWTHPLSRNKRPLSCDLFI